MELKDKIYQRRKELDLTLEEVGQIVGVGKSTVRKWETGEIDNMKLDKIELLAKALRVTPAWLMGWDEETDGHYLDPEVAAYAQQIHQDPDLRILFDASKKLTKEDIDFVVQMVKKMKPKDDDYA